VVGGADVIRRAVRLLDERTGQAPLLRRTLRYVFPDHWSFMLGEVALYSFVFLVASGTYLALFFEPSLERTIYHGSYAPLAGREVTVAYASALDLSFEVKAGLLIRQAHHWAANVFLVAIVLHVLRIFFTGAYRKPRDLTYFVGVSILGLALVEGFLGYSLLDDLLSGMGLAIAYSVVMAIPVVGANVALLLWGGEFPGDHSFMSRMYVGHVFLLPVAIGALIGLHLLLVALRHHTQFPGRERTERNVVGTPLWPGYALRSLGLLFAVVSVLLLLGGLVQVNPVWLWGPYEPWLSTNGAQPDWYLGWLIGALRLMPSWEPSVAGYTLFPNAFFGGALFPLLVFAFLYAWPALERRFSRDYRFHHLLDRPRDAGWRTASGVAFFTWVALVFLAGSSDRLFVGAGIPYTWQILTLRGLVLGVPLVAFVVTRRVCGELVAREETELRRAELESR
jgi:ubiquinol-cytochrome c reductase cytochrome b subunit